MKRLPRQWLRGPTKWIRTLCAVASLLATSPSFAEQWWSHGDASLSVNGSLRELAFYSQQTDFDDFREAIVADIAASPPTTTCLAAASFANCPAFNGVGDKDVVQSLTRLRIQADLRLTEWLSMFASYDNEIQAGSLDTLEADLGGGFSSKSFLEAEANLSSGSNHDWRHRLYRGYLRIETERFELSIGRQRIAWGVGRLWTPIDRFSALLPLNLQPGVTPGIDSLNGQFNFFGFDYLQFVYAPGSSRKRERWAVRLHGVVLDADLSAMGGIFEGAPTVGVDFSRNLGAGAIAFEAVFTSPRRDVWKVGDGSARSLSDYWQIVASFDINLDYGSGVYVLAEYLYNGNALGFGRGRAGVVLPFFESTNQAPFQPLPPGAPPAPYVKGASNEIAGSSRIITNSEHQLGLELGYDLTPELRGDFVTLVDMDGGSAAFVPSLRYSPFGSIELTFGAQLFTGQRRSQYGASQPLAYVLADWFF